MSRPSRRARFYVLEGTLSAGMEYPQLKLAIISHAKTGVSRTRAPKQKKGGHIKNLSDLNVGDYVVHVIPRHRHL